MGLTDTLFNATSLADQLEGAITAGESQDLLVALTGHPVHGKNRRVNIHDFGFL